MSFFRRANPETHVRLSTPDGGDWIELYTDFSKEQVNKIVMAAPNQGDDRSGAMKFVERFFEIAVKDWSMADEKGNPVKPTVAEFRLLANDAAKWIEERLSDHITEYVTKAGDAVEGKASE
jgi:hypothetical protein